MSDKYTTETASIRATIGKFRKLDTDKLTIKGQDISELVGTGGGSGSVTIKHAQDTRETVTENDLWGQWVETLEDGTVIVHDNYVQSPNADDDGYVWNTSITKVEDNKAYVGDTLLFANIQFDRVKNGSQMFYGCTSLTVFSEELPIIENGYKMFQLCSALTSFSSDLSSLTDGKMMFSNCPVLTSFSSNLAKLTNGSNMFESCENLTTFTSDLPSLENGLQMFSNCSELTSFTSDLPKLTNGSSMFYGCNNFTSFSSNLSSLTNGYMMFYNCSKLTSFISDLPNLSEADWMFYNCDNLTSFSSVLTNLVDGSYMFQDCSKLTTFSSDLSSLIEGSYMFYLCSKLTTFSSDLSSLIEGICMLSYCKLNPQSVMYIIDSINDITAEKQLYTRGIIPYVTYNSTTQKYSAPRGFMSDGKYVYTCDIPSPYTTSISASDVGKLTIGIDVSNNSSTIDQQLQDFAEGTLFDSWDDLKQAFAKKGWTVTWQYGGTGTSITYDLRDGERIIPCPVYTKLIEILPQEGEELTEKQKNGAEYCNEDGTKFYNIEWGHDVAHPEEFQQFDSLETACVTYGVMPKEYLETNGQPTLF